MKDIKFLKNNLISHRGIHYKYPENSIPAFKEAIKNNYIIELDVHLLKDNTVVVFHDDNLYRMTSVKDKIINYKYDDLKKLKLQNTIYKIPTLEEVLKLINGKVPVIVELKYDRKLGLLEKEVVKLLDNYKGDFCIQSFNFLSVRWFKKHRPNYLRGLLLSNNKNKTIIDKLLSNKLILNLTKPDFLSCNYKLANNKRVINYMKKNPVIAWTIRTSKQLNKNKDLFYNVIVDFNEETMF